MTPVSDEIIEAAIQILGTEGISEEEIEQSVRALVSDDMTARRLIDWLPVAFGTEAISRLFAKISVPDTFFARMPNDKLATIKLTQEPIFTAAFERAKQMVHGGPEQFQIYQNLALQSSMLNSVNNALHSGANLDGAVLSGPAFLGIPAEVYGVQPKPSLWQRLFGK